MVGARKGGQGYHIHQNNAWKDLLVKYILKFKQSTDGVVYCVTVYYLHFFFNLDELVLPIESILKGEGNFPTLKRTNQNLYFMTLDVYHYLRTS